MSESTSKLTERWIHAEESLRHAESRRSQASTDLKNAVNALGKHIAPPDMKDGETVSIWVRVDRKTERVLEVKRETVNTYHLRWRGGARPVEPVF